VLIILGRLGEVEAQIPKTSLLLVQLGFAGMVVGFLLLGVGFLLVGITILRVNVLPRWCGVVVAIASATVFAAVLPPGFILGSYIERLGLGVTWLVLTYELWTHKAMVN